MRSSFRILLSLICIVIVLLTVHLYLLDGLDGWIFSRLVESDTRYASGYSDNAFREVKAGMSFADVTDILGSPLHAWAVDDAASWHPVDLGEISNMNGLVTCVWSDSPNDRSYHIRKITFTDHFVANKHSDS